MDSTDLDLGAKWHDRPLCCRYLLAHFAVQEIQVRMAPAAHGWSVTWALGTFGDGQREALGAWPHSVDGVLNWHAVFDDLATRGVERIRFVVGSSANAAGATFVHFTKLNSVVATAQIGVPPAGLPPRLKRVADTAEVAAQQMQAGLARMIHRHGSFESPHAALPFLAAALQRLEKRARARLTLSGRI